MSNGSNAKITLSTKGRFDLFTNLSTMLTAGIPIIEAVESLLSDSKGNQKKVLARIRASLNNGDSLTNTLEQMPKAFDPISINLIRSAEAGGTLDATLRDIIKATKKEMDFSDQLRTAMVYPLFVCVVFSAIVILMLTFVIPRVSEVFTSLHVKIPWITRVMIKASNIFTVHWLLVICGLAIILILLGLVIKVFKAAMIRAMFSLPIIKRLGINIDLARYTRSFSLLMQAGVPIIESLELSEKVVKNSSLQAIVKQMRYDANAGKPLATSLRETNGLIPVVMYRSLRTAEKSGTLNQTLAYLNEYFDEQVNVRLKILSSLLEPLLIVIVGIMVGALMISIIAPIYNMISQINPSTT